MSLSSLDHGFRLGWRGCGGSGWGLTHDDGCWGGPATATRSNVRNQMLSSGGRLSDPNLAMRAEGATMAPGVGANS